ncbi:PH domain-containing protein [Myceligenerans pegani]|uniref:PH domain-containing protein n=1 Tax=Myceligenerans pegani TaxID=2776917 RepID=A0ABR9N4K0_9MICO|nr:PH domain-containing protein [Myceligenerans sp. TRM 65318]MBE1878034.1 PH domain-containing protein [Myceligenerans sp. TRM 65318]MBE3020305.1 PH domain-containing protein [Myceligenerans sp. TRM 65318]
MTETEEFLRGHRGLRKYILSGEEIIFATHRHWIRLWEPVLTTVGSFVVLVVVFLAASSEMRDILVWLFWGWALVVGRLGWKYLEWRHDWLLMTSLRLMTVTGFVVQRVATMPRDKVTDLGYRQDVLGQILGYGTFHFESAGQDQTLGTEEYIPSSDSLYRTLMTALFHPDADPKPPQMPPSILPKQRETPAEADPPDPEATRSTPRTQQIQIRPTRED